MNRDTAIGLPDRLHKAQNEFYAGAMPVGLHNSATGLDLGFYAARWYSLRRPPRVGWRDAASSA